MRGGVTRAGICGAIIGLFDGITRSFCDASAVIFDVIRRAFAVSCSPGPMRGGIARAGVCGFVVDFFVQCTGFARFAYPLDIYKPRITLIGADRFGFVVHVTDGIGICTDVTGVQLDEESADAFHFVRARGVANDISFVNIDSAIYLFPTYIRIAYRLVGIEFGAVYTFIELGIDFGRTGF